MLAPLDLSTIAAAPDWLFDLASGAPAPPSNVVALSPPPTADRPQRAPDGQRWAYGRTVLDRECGELAAVTRGNRNGALNDAALALATLFACGAVDEGEARDRLVAAAEANGLVRDKGRRAVLATIESGFRYGRANPRSVPDRPAHPDPGRPAVPRPAMAFAWHGEPDQARPSWRVKGLLPTTGIVLLAGQSAAGKTFLAQSLAGAGATGGTWFGRKVRERFGTLFLCGEGVGTFPDRLEALRVGQIEPTIGAATAETGELPMFVSGRLPIAWSPCDGLRDPSRMAEVTAAVREQAGTMQRDHGVPLGVIVVDTLAATVGLDDENNASECTAAMKALEKLSTDTGALVVAIAHFGKTEGTGVRGSSALTASADTILAAVVEKDDLGAVHTRKLALTKSRYAETGWHQAFKLRSIVLGEDEDGDPITSCCIEPVEAEEVPAGPREARLSPAARAYVQALAVVIGEHGSRLYPFGVDGPEVVAVDQERVRDEFYASWPADGDTEQQRQEARRKRFNAGRKQAVERHVIGLRDLNGTTVVWPIEPHA